MNAIEIKDFYLDVDNRTIFDGLNLILPMNEISVIVGRSGSGKSLLASVLAFVFDANGYVKVLGKFLNPMNKKYIMNNVGYLSPKYMPYDVIDDVYFKELGIEYLKDKKDGITASERMFLAFLSMLSKKYKILIIDDAFSIVPSDIRKKMWAMLEGRTVVYFTSNLNYVNDISNVYLIHNMGISKENVLENHSLFKHNGVELPFMIDLSSRLSYYRQICVTEKMDDLVNELWT